MRKAVHYGNTHQRNVHIVLCATNPSSTHSVRETPQRYILKYDCHRKKKHNDDQKNTSKSDLSIESKLRP